MTPQASFMILAPIVPERESELRRLLASMNDAPGRVNPSNALIPFDQFDTLHFARFVILDDKTLEDVRVHGMPVRIYPIYLAFLGDIDGDPNAFLGNLAKRAERGLRSIFSCCEGFASDTDLAGWMKSHSVRPTASYVNWRGRTVRRIREDEALKHALEEYVQRHATVLTGIPPREILSKLQQFVAAEKSAGRLALSDESPTPIGWSIRNALHLIGVPLLFLLALPLLIVIAPFFLIRLRRLEKTDVELCGRVDQAHSDGLSLLEDRDVTNQFNAMASRKPGFVRLLTLLGVLATVDYAARHIVRNGRLGRIRTIHFARWVLLDGRKRGTFFSNYDGTVESYMDDFINKAGFGLNAIFCNAIGYPRTNWLVRDGCEDEQKYRNFLRRHTLPTQVWYKAYPGLTAIDLERNRRIRDGLESSSMSERETREWLALL
ncbi:MAG TPA: hypothetical protein VGL25_02485 [Casimicrobiaceae bacterium]